MSSSYNEVMRGCTPFESIYHPFSKIYTTKGSTMSEVFYNISEICIKKNFGEPELLPDKSGYYCGYIKKPMKNIYLFNTIFMGYRESQKCYVAMMSWNSFINKKTI
jgi:hypothetical protein